MNKKQVIRIKKIIGYDSSNPEHKRLLNRLKKEFKALEDILASLSLNTFFFTILSSFNSVLSKLKYFFNLF